MLETFNKNITMVSLQKKILDYKLGLLKTPNIQVIDQKLFDEIIQFPTSSTPDLTLNHSTFKRSELMNMKFIQIDFDSSFFENCLVKNCIFKNIDLNGGTVKNSVFENCQFIDCRLIDWDVEKTIFNKCKFVRSGFDKSIFISCDFQSPKFEGDLYTFVGSASLENSKFSNSKKSMKFEGDVFFEDIIDQINKLFLE